MSELGALAGALAKAQPDFATVTRDKEVRVKTKSGGEYTFKYAPLDSILGAVREPLSKNGLVLIQMLDEGALVTSLIHESGAILSGRVDLPPTADIQAYGSAITYLRRYAIQAMLGIAAEDDDDGNQAAGNIAAPVHIPAPERTDDGGLIGVVEVGTAKDSDLELRETPDGWAIGFRLKANGRGGIKVVARDALAQAIAAWKSNLVGQRVTAWGHITDESFKTKGDKPKTITYQVLQLERLTTPDFTLPAPPSDFGQQQVLGEGVVPVAPGQETLPLSEEEKAAIAGGLSA